MNHVQPLVVPSWQSASRLALPADSLVASTALLLGMGSLATLASFLEFKLKLPGNSIIRGVLPVALGLALVPRLGSGTTMTVGSLLMVLFLRSIGHTKGLGGTTSLVLLGPMFDLALLAAKPNWMLYVRFALAGMAANGLAFAVQVTAKSYGLSLGGGKDFRTWISLATFTYPLFGLIAGLVSGLLFFHWSPLGNDRAKPGRSQP